MRVYVYVTFFCQNLIFSQIPIFKCNFLVECFKKVLPAFQNYGLHLILVGTFLKKKMSLFINQLIAERKQMSSASHLYVHWDLFT